MRDEDRLVVVTPWYPTPDAVFAGSFVREWTATLGHAASRTEIIHVAAVAHGEESSAAWEASPDGAILRIRVPVAPSTPRHDVMVACGAALTRYAAGVLAAADVVIAHVGVPTGAAVAPLLRADAVLVTVEHASYLETALRDPRVARAYEAMMARSTRHLMVGENGASRLRRLMPAVADRVVAVGNPVDARLFSEGPRRVRLDRWLYLGNFTVGKGIDHALRAFAVFAASRPGASFTIVGDGPQRSALEALASELGLAASVRIAAPVSPGDVPALFARHDLLIHLSESETFGLTAVEAAMTGLPAVVRRSDGPADSLDTVTATGMIRLVDSVEPRATAGAVLELEARLPTADPAHARAEVVARFGRAAFGRRLGAVIDGRPWWEPRVGTDVVIVAGTDAGARAVAGPAREAVRLGLPTAIATVVPERARGVDASVAIVAIVDNAARAAGRATRGAVVGTAPRALVVGTRAAAGLLERAPGLASPARRLQRAAGAMLMRLDAGQSRPGPRVITRTPDGAAAGRLADAVVRALHGAPARGTLMVPCDDRAADACEALAARYGAVVVSDTSPGMLAVAVSRMSA